MRVVMIAPPGAGKDTQGGLVAAHFGIPRVVIGDVLRGHVARRTDLGRAIRAHLDRGELVPDEIVLRLAREALIDTRRLGGGIVIDGVPRTVAQAQAGYEQARELGMAADVALHLEADDRELTRRLLARAEREHRSDDTEPVIRRRLELYHEVTHPIVEWYRKRRILISVDAMRPIPEVGRDVLAALEAA
ncbi:adenylate kinase [Dactylosporangium sp. CS-047395]|uniref:adenylate kinase n=1 Tax=Dactylosporangium sp. CS-047395 TaxID=3239936 RepID=UPI003D929720